ncbi:MAG: helix-turn-helix domain-containing protein [Bacteroidota bacterium]
MNSASSKQTLFLKRIEDVLDSSTSLVFEIAELLGISNDSAYRRMRGETLLSIDEIIKLCDHFNISFDAFSKAETGAVTFAYNEMEDKTENLLLYLKGVLKDIKGILATPNCHITYASQDIPVFYHYNHPEMAAFKFFYWMRSIMNVTDVEMDKFNPGLIDPEIYSTARQIFDVYSQIPSTEIWTNATINSTLKQIEFYWDGGIFNSKEEAIAICNALKQEILSIQKQAETGKKNHKPGENDIANEKNYELYYSEIEITNNCVLVNLNTLKAVYLSHFSFYTMKTMNDNYCNKTEKWLHSLLKKTTLISGVGEKTRNQFFNKAHRDIDNLILRIQKEE